MSNRRKITVTIDQMILVLWTIIVCVIAYCLKKNTVPGDSWYVSISIFAVIQLILQICYMKKSRVGLLDFRLWFIIFAYLFLFGKQFLSSIIGDSIYDNARIYPRLYDVDLMYAASLFSVASIQAIFTGFFLKNIEKSGDSIIKSHLNAEPSDSVMYISGVILTFISFMCALITDGRNILTVQTTGSYHNVSGGTGLIDDFALLLVPAVLYVLFSGKISKKSSRLIILLLSMYYIFVMMLTGDRRYPIISIIVLFLAYVYLFEFKFSIKHFLLMLPVAMILNFFTVLRKIRHSDMVSASDFIKTYGLSLFDFSNTIFETLNEFGTTFFTVCLAIMSIPKFFAYRYGTSILTGIISIIPFGFLYKNSVIYTYGRLTDLLNNYYGTHPGGSVFGDMYANFGLWGVPLFIFLGYFITSIVFRKTNNIRKNSIFYFTLFYSLFNLVRASFTEVIRTSVWGIFIPLIIYGLLNNILKKRNSSKKFNF